mmetsp:Transcript_13963/g.42113  ORF Transcript_13963/g.42113 Transcript_13963/m.42113 type:complete len:202 (-) Transcript_13963:646-1251(-)
MSGLASLRTFLRSTSDNQSQVSSATSSGSPMSGLARSFPSMDDFSCGARQEAEERHFSPHATDVPSQPAFEVLHRGSLDSSGYTPRSPSPPPMGQSTLLGRLSVDGGSRPHPSRRPSLATASFGPSPSFHHHHHTAAMNIPQLRPSSTAVPEAGTVEDGFAQTAPLHAEDAAHRRPPGRPEGKIDGMDYYGWCELLRSSSL